MAELSNAAPDLTGIMFQVFTKIAWNMKFAIGLALAIWLVWVSRRWIMRMWLNLPKLTHWVRLSSGLYKERRWSYRDKTWK